jgi:hypothetical protein
VADFTFDLNVVGLEDIGLGYFLRHAGRRRGFGTARDDLIEPFPSCLSLAELQYVDCLGDLAGFPGAAAELVEDVPGLELVLSCAFALSPSARSFAWARLASFCGSGLFLPLYGTFA